MDFSPFFPFHGVQKTSVFGSLNQEERGVEWDSNFAYVYVGHGEGTVKIDIINVETNKSIGTIKVRVK